MTPSRERFPCKQCGAWLEFAPGSTSLQCPYCAATTTIATEVAPIHEQDFEAWLAAGGAVRVATLAERHLRCAECGAETKVDESTAATRCAFCGTPLIAQPSEHRVIRPAALLPFKVQRTAAQAALGAWMKRLWFAPNALTRDARKDDPIQGLYLPYWTYDSFTHTDYRGERGDDYWDTESYTITVNGRTEHRTRQVRRTRWRSVSGDVDVTFDDVLVLASPSVPETYARRLEPWDLGALTPFDERFLAGFIAEAYRVDLAQGFERAKAIMKPSIEARIRSDIGGDHQRISWMQTRYYDVSFKHLLLPIWSSTYRYRGKVYRFLVNGRTGEVQGERPYSAWKIAFAVLLGLLVVGGIALIAKGAS